GQEPALEERLVMVVVVIVVMHVLTGLDVTADGCHGYCLLRSAAGDQPWFGTTGSSACATRSAWVKLEPGWIASQPSNSACGTACTTIGMKPWSLPHSSAHWPR